MQFLLTAGEGEVSSGGEISGTASDLVTFARSDDANLAICTVTAGIRRAAGQTVLRSKFVADSKERRQKLFHFRGNERVAPCLGGEALQVRIGM